MGAGAGLWGGWEEVWPGSRPVVVGHVSPWFRALSLVPLANLGFLTVQQPQNCLSAQMMQLTDPGGINQKAKWTSHDLCLSDLSSEEMWQHFSPILVGTNETQSHTGLRGMDKTFMLAGWWPGEHIAEWVLLFFNFVGKDTIFLTV